MASKKSSKNGFMKFCLLQQKNSNSLSGLSTSELVLKCSPIWEKMSIEERNHFKSEGQLSGGSYPKGGNITSTDSKFDSFGRPLSELARIKKADEMRKIKMKNDIQETVEDALANNILEDKTFFLLSTNVFCITSELIAVPAELSIAKISLNEGILDVYLVYIDPGAIPRGWRSDCVANSKATHKIPLDFHGFETDYNKILNEILSFLCKDNEDNEELPPMYCLEKNYTQNMLVLNWLIARAKSLQMDQDFFRIYDLSMLMFELTRDNNRSIDSLSLVKNRVPTLNIAAIHLNRDNFMFMPGMFCKFHEEQECLHCCQSTVKGWAYTIFKHVCPLLNIPMRVPQHMPVGYDSGDSGVSEFLSSSRSRSSIISGDCGSSIRSGSTIGMKKKYLNPSMPASSEATKALKERLELMFKSGKKTSELDISTSSEFSNVP